MFKDAFGFPQRAGSQFIAFPGDGVDQPVIEPVATTDQVVKLPPDLVCQDVEENV